MSEEEVELRLALEGAENVDSIHAVSVDDYLQAMCHCVLEIIAGTGDS